MTSEGPAAFHAAGPSALPPDVVVVCVDTLRADHVTPELTPNIWRIARRGVRFDRAWAEFPLTVPFRISAVTGTYTFTNRPWSALRPSDRHLAEMFRAAGYQTAAFSDSPFRAEVGLDRGFDTFEELPGKLGVAGAAAGRRSDDLNQSLPPAWVPDWRDDDRDRWRRFRDGWLPARADGMAGATALIDRTCRWLDARDPARPSLVWVDLFECHEPWLSPDDEQRAREHPWPFERFLPLPPGPDASWMSPADRAQVRDLYCSEVRHADAAIGRLVDRLDATDSWDHTVVVVFSDHGVPLGAHGRMRKYDVPLTDEMARIPWIMAVPGVDGGRCSQSPVQTPDLLATLVDLCTLEVPDGNAYGDGVDFPGRLEGHSLVPVLRGDDGTRAHAFIGVFGTRAAIVRWPYKLIDRRGEGPNELFDLETDPGEAVNLAASQTDLATELHHALWRFQHRWARALRA